MKVYYDNDVLSRLARLDETGPESDALMKLQELRNNDHFTKVTSRLSWREQQRVPVEKTRLALRQNRPDTLIVEEDWISGSNGYLEGENGDFAAWYTGTQMVDERLYRGFRLVGLEDDDACHLMFAVHDRCDRFLTLDADFLGNPSNFRRRDLEQYCRGLRIVKPSELLTELNSSKALTRSDEPFDVNKLEIVDGIPVLPSRGVVITKELVDRLMEEADLEDAGELKRD